MTVKPLLDVLETSEQREEIDTIIVLAEQYRPELNVVVFLARHNRWDDISILAYYGRWNEFSEFLYNITRRKFKAKRTESESNDYSFNEKYTKYLR